ncbi:MAG: sulfatase [bacterium]|nr:sulfatase [bacterium]
MVAPRKMKSLFLAACCWGVCVASVACSRLPSASVESATRPNVLFIAVDDLNDWIEPLGGHPQAKTPELDRLAAESVLFARNYCASPACNPSRVALLTGLHTYTSGMYSNYQYWREILPEVQTLPQYFMEHGYRVAGAGKIFHNNMPDPDSWEDYYPSKERHMPDYFRPKPGETVNMPAFEDMYGDFDWAPIDLSDEQTGDYSSVGWIIDQLHQEHERPFFLACGIYRPHVPWYVPQKYFDLFPLESVQLPQVLDDDLDDVGERARELARRAGDYHKHVIEAGQWQAAVQGYLASIAFADAMVGRLVTALDNSPHARNTIVILWSDHGWQLGEKEHWRKFALWDNVARTVLMIRVPFGTVGLPEGSVTGARCERVTSLLDIYPTLTELCELPPKAGLDGRSLVPLLRNPGTEWNHPAITTYDFSEYSVRTERWRYIRYIDDSEELYDHDNDPEEWTNLAQNPAFRAIKDELSRYLPSDPAPVVETSYKLSAHHIPPLKSKEEYLKQRGR